MGGFFCFAKIVRIIVGENKQRAVHKRYRPTVVGNGPFGMVLISKYNGVFYSCDEQYFVCTHWTSAGDRHLNEAYLPDTYAAKF